MLSNSTQIGATTQGTTFADIIINNVNGVADGMIQGFAQFVHDPKSLKETVQIFSKAAAPRKFADAVVLRRIETQKLDDIWNFPLNMAVPTTCPIPWTIIEATVKSQVGNTSWEFNLMRTVDFIGRNYIRFILPAIDTSQIVDPSINSNADIMSDPEHMYLGAWHRDLIPRLIQNISFYPRSNCHKLFEYSGYDLFVHNILFGNANKEMNDLMAGEDKFELCYDPYRVDGSAMGIASFKGIDAFSEYNITEGPNGFQTYTPSSTVLGATDGIIDYFQLDTTMDNEEFRNVYRRNVWYEAPVAKNYHARHSIHSRRMFHQAKDIIIPLDILPFGYSIASSLPAAALSGECGFIKITLHSDWLDRAFYLTKVSDIPSLHPIVNHVHYEPGDTTPNGDTLNAADPNDPSSVDDPRLGWVNERSLGRFGDPKFEATRTQYKDGDKVVDGFESNHKFSTPGNVLNTPVGFNNRENIVPTTVTFDDDSVTGTKGLYRGPGGRGGMATNAHAALRTKGNWQSVQRTSTTADLTSAGRNDRLTDSTGKSDFTFKMSIVDPTYYNQVKEQIGVKLLQVGYQTLPCIREFLAKLPNIYITTEWDDKDRSINEQTFDINNDLYIQGIIMWIIPTDNNNLESLRVYPCHMIDHELPLLAGLRLINEQSQGTTIYDWAMLNVLNPAQMNLNPLIENMGLISFSPSLTANTLPLAYYDSNISGYLKCDLKSGENGTNIGAAINLKQGYIKIITIGVNGVASVNLNLFRLVF
ncbi:MAG: hypothetical protein ACOX6N_05615 [Patescibacteria group bacterium]|jgi:hypothetical protein